MAPIEAPVFVSIVGGRMNNDSQTSISAAMEVFKAAPSIGAILTGWMSVPVETWAVRAGLAFILMQAAYMAWRWWRDIKHERRIDRRRHLDQDEE